jgi:hypothetical protein
MMQAIEVEKYRGVLCRSCKQAIPLPAVVTSLEAERNNIEEGSENQLGALVFTLRCRACDKEQPYRSSEIVDFEGTPRPRLSRSHAARALRLSNLARAANA